VRQLFMAMPLVFGLALAFLPLQAMGSAAENLALLGSAAEPVLQHGADRNATAGHEHKHSGFDDCGPKAGHCASGGAMMTIDGQGHLMVAINTNLFTFRDALRVGLRPLPLLPPPEYI